MQSEFAQMEVEELWKALFGKISENERDMNGEINFR